MPVGLGSPNAGSLPDEQRPFGHAVEELCAQDPQPEPLPDLLLHFLPPQLRLPFPFGRRPTSADALATSLSAAVRSFAVLARLVHSLLSTIVGSAPPARFAYPATSALTHPRGPAISSASASQEPEQRAEVR